jgi:hypothetical protein
VEETSITHLPSTDSPYHLSAENFFQYSQY